MDITREVYTVRNTGMQCSNCGNPLEVDSFAVYAYANGDPYKQLYNVCWESNCEDEINEEDGE